jgi:Holliday junction resolvase-like predicted endonuclease
MTSAEIGNTGERYATDWLRSKGYQCYRNTQLPGSTDIEASGPANLLVQVKTAVYPSSASGLSADENRNIIARANRNGWQAWLAKVQINYQGSMIGDIGWTKLN